MKKLFPKAIFAAILFVLPCALFAHGDVHLQIVALTEILTKTPSAEVFLRRGELFRIDQDWKSAEADYEKAARLDSNLFEVDFCRGRMLLEAGRLSEGLVCINKLLTAHSNYGPAYVTRARLQLRMGNLEAAGDDFSTALSNLENPSPDIYLERARAVAGTSDKKINAALKGLDEGIKRFGPIVTLQLCAIDLELKRKHYDDALKRIETIAAQSERKEAWLARRADVLVLAGRAGEARKTFSDALSEITLLPERLQQNASTRELKARIERSLAGLGN